MKNNRQIGFATRAIHVGQEPDPLTGAVTVPIYPTSTYVQQGIGEHKGYEYSRVSNPTRTRLEENLAALEGGWRRAFLPAAWQPSTAVTSLLKSGDHVICATIFTVECRGCSIRSGLISDSSSPTWTRPKLVMWNAPLRRNTRMVYVETPTNPLMRLSDIRAIAAICRRRKTELIVDNTFMSPYFQQPFALGADMVVHSTTKFLNGHSDGLGGVVVCSKPEQAEKLAFMPKRRQERSCLLLSAGWCCAVKTLAARMSSMTAAGVSWRGFWPNIRK